MLVLCLTTFQITEMLNWALVLLPGDFQDIMYAASGGKERNAKHAPRSYCSPDCCMERNLHLPAREPGVLLWNGLLVKQEGARSDR